MRWQPSFLYTDFGDNGRGAADPGGGGVHQRIADQPEASDDQCVQPVWERDQVHRSALYRGSGKCRKQCDLFLQLDTVGRPPTILSGTPERSGRVCLTVWRPGR